MPATSVGVVVSSSPNQVGTGALNSTIAPQTAGDVQNTWNQRLEVLESMAASRPSLDSVTLGQTIGEAVGKQLRVSQKRSRSPDGAPEEPVAELINVHGQDDNHRVFCWEWRRGRTKAYNIILSDNTFLQLQLGKLSQIGSAPLVVNYFKSAVILNSNWQKKRQRFY